MCISLPVQMTSCLMTSFMNKAARGAKQACLQLSFGNGFCYNLLFKMSNVVDFFKGTLSSIPTALTRWTDECKVLDAESMHDCVAGIYSPL